jgi:hypothetical protein
MILVCAKNGCGEKEPPYKLEEHYLIPKFLGGKDKDSRKYLCHKHHAELHKLLGEHDKELTLQWLNQ